MNRIDLEGRVAIVTGGAQGIGYATAERMLRSGAAVVLWDSDAARLDEARGKLSAHGRVATVQVELTDDSAVAAAAARATAEQGRIDILVNNAGITGGNATTWELDAGGLAARRRGEPDRAVPHLPRGGAADARARLWPHRQRGVGGRQGRQPERLALQRVEGGPDRADEVAGEGDWRRAACSSTRSRRRRRRPRCSRR